MLHKYVQGRSSYQCPFWVNMSPALWQSWEIGDGDSSLFTIFPINSAFLSWCRLRCPSLLGIFLGPGIGGFSIFHFFRIELSGTDFCTQAAICREVVPVCSCDTFPSVFPHSISFSCTLICSCGSHLSYFISLLWSHIDFSGELS